MPFPASESVRTKMEVLLSRFVSGIVVAAALLLAAAASAQVIEYESNGQKYQTLTRAGLTVIVTHLPNQIAGFGMMQVSIANGSTIYWTVRPEAFSYVRQGTPPLVALPANQIVDLLLERGSHNDVVKLANSYEASLYGIPHMRSTNGYEERRQNSRTFGVSAKLEAAAMASAIAFAQTRIAAGQSTDGAIFFPLPHDMKTLTGGKLVLHVEAETFEFNPD